MKKPRATAPSPRPASAAQGARKVPLQARSRERVERILAAAAEEFVAIGYDAATTEAIAERAGTSIGSLYQFFPNKLALFEAISAQYLAEASALYDRLVTPELEAQASWMDLITLTLDGFAAFHRNSVAFRAVWMNWKLSPEFLEAGEALNREFARRTEELLARRSNLTKPERELVATLIVEVMSAMLLVAVRRETKEGDALLDETKVLMRRYLAPYVKAEAAPARPKAKKARATK